MRVLSFSVREKQENSLTEKKQSSIDMKNEQSQRAEMQLELIVSTLTKHQTSIDCLHANVVVSPLFDLPDFV